MLSASCPEMNVGIHAIELYVPNKFVSQSKLEEFDCVSAGKYTIGLGQDNMTVVDDLEDIQSICLTAVDGLMKKYGIDPKSVGRLEIGVDTTNACYGGTNALFNSINWLESTSYDGRYAICVAADIAVYKTGSARPTGGAGAVAILLGRDAPLVFDTKTRATHVEHVYDFYKPDLHSEYPEVDGPLSNKCYTNAVDLVYNRYLEKSKDVKSLEDFDYVCFHSPYTKLVQKSFGRLLYNDFKRNPKDPKFESLKGLGFENVTLKDSFGDRVLEKKFMELTKSDFSKKVMPGLLAAKNMGNMYCGSLYGGLASLLSSVSPQELLNKRIGLFSYGSGLASSFFSLKCVGSVERIHSVLNLKKRLESRTEIAPAEFDEIMKLREKTHNCKNYEPVGNLEMVSKGTWYLERVDEKFRRSYLIKE